jgi:hypothetical protein
MRPGTRLPLALLVVGFLLAPGCGGEREFKEPAGAAGAAGKATSGGAASSAGRSGGSTSMTAGRSSASNGAGEGGAAGASAADAGEAGAAGEPPVSCEPGEVLDDENGRCRDPIGCDEADCDGACEEGGFAEDARCFDCAEGQGVHPETRQCFRCETQLNCDAEGETGLVLALAARGGSQCLCETRRGYYPDEEGRSTRRCDTDGDGWVSERAEPAVESESEVTRDNARCSVRYIERFVLMNEAGEPFPVPRDADDLVRAFAGDDERDLPAGLPLYESAQNDGANGVLPLYGTEELGRRLEPAELNSLTRACMSEEMDANDNGVPDVSESPESERGEIANESVARYYAKYAEYSYFLELFQGRFEAADKTYVIAERTREDFAAPIRYPLGAPDYVLSCERHPDALYTWSNGALTAPNTAGADFLRFGAASGIGHPSQFKCVHLVTPEEYGSATEQTRPELVTIDQSSGAYRLRRQAAAAVDYAWTTNSCYATDTTPRDGNPSYATIVCAPDLMRPQAGSVRWAAVGYEPYANSAPYVSVDEPGGYRRGCVNACAEVIEGVDCYACDATVFGEGSISELAAGSACGATGQVCDGAGHCGDCIPGAGRCVTGAPELCSSEGLWTPQTACAPGWTCLDGTCRTTADGQPCNDASECTSLACTSFYRDVDGDGFGVATATKLCGTSAPTGYVANNQDCCDADILTKPTQTGEFVVQNGCGNFDYDCRNGAEKTLTNYYACLDCYYWFSCLPGWASNIPECGLTGGWFDSGCGYTSAQQACR